MSMLVFFALLGAVQGILLLLLILFRFRHTKNIPLALLILVFSLRLGTIPTWNLQTLQAYPWIWPLTSTLPFLFGPLLYWTIESIRQRSAFRLSCIHFVPYFLATLGISIYLLLISPSKYRQRVDLLFKGNIPLWMLGINGLKVLLNGLYVGKSIQIAYNHTTRTLSEIHRIWIQALTVIPTLVFILFCYVALNPDPTAQLQKGNTGPFTMLAIGMSSLVYTLSVMVLIAPASLEEGGIPLKYNGRNYLSDEACKTIVQQVQTKLAKGAFKNPVLNEEIMARSLGIHPNRLSMAINRSLQIPFRTLLNQYRIQYIKQILNEGSISNKTILQIAFEAGFSSKSTFNRVFKEQTGKSPRDYVKNLNI